jgi:hypothetical protein
MSSQVASNDTGDEALGACIAQAVRRWTFPAAPGVVTVNYPFMLSR